MYVPKVNDYVKWKPHIEGWVYFTDKEYITIEVDVRPKDEVNYDACRLHRNERLLVLCYSNQWKELNYIKSRKSVYEEEKDSLEMVGKSIRRESI
jgi:hypothetical protein